MLGPGSSSDFVETGGAVDGVTVVGGLLVILGVEESSIEA
jgi:hypothetical protein